MVEAWFINYYNYIIFIIIYIFFQSSVIIVSRGRPRETSVIIVFCIIISRIFLSFREFVYTRSILLEKLTNCSLLAQGKLENHKYYVFES